MKGTDSAVNKSNGEEKSRRGEDVGVKHIENEKSSAVFRTSQLGS